MKYHRLEELLELLLPEWKKSPDLNLVEFLQLLANEADFKDTLNTLTDDVLIYHLKMRSSAKDALIPGIAKDYESDFKSALLKARGIES